ncbi:MAG: beta-propeller fold lactonase family protein [Candidatus Eremiobacteraeota bacterium]|nr:beta-propeller fold lactonase family protein [Candidatus Eremiobacteraeota bacterium]
MKQILKIAVLIIALVIIVIQPAFTKQKGSIVGVVITSGDPTTAFAGAAPVDNATVILLETGLRQTTDANGSFNFSNLKPGKYTVIIQKPGYGPIQKSIVVERGVIHRVTLTLLPGASPSQDSGPIPSDTAFVAFGSTVSQPPTVPGMPQTQGYPYSASAPQIGQYMTKMGYLQAVGAGADPFSVGHNVNMPVWPQGMPDPANPYASQTMITTNPNNIMMLNGYDKGSVNYLALQKKPYWLTFNLSGTKLYVSTEEGRIEVYDVLHNNILVGMIPVNGVVSDMKLSPDGQRLFVAVQSGQPGIMIINTNNNSLEQMIPTPTLTTGEAGSPTALAVSRGGNRLYVAMATANSGEVAVIDVPNQRLWGVVPVGMRPTGIDLSRDGSRLYVANYNSGDVAVVDGYGLKVITRIRVGIQPARIAIRPDGKKVFVTNNGSNNVSVIDTERMSVISTIPVGRSPMGIAVTSDGRTVFVANNGEGTVSVIDGERFVVRYTTQPLPNSTPYGVVVKP